MFFVPRLVQGGPCHISQPIREILNQLVNMVACFWITPILFLITERSFYSPIIY
jgi:hypothetical protein